MEMGKSFSSSPC